MKWKVYYYHIDLEGKIYIWEMWRLITETNKPKYRNKQIKTLV